MTRGEKEVSGLSRITKLFGKTELDCVEVRKLSSEYLEGDLPPSRLQRFRDHISKCGPCQSFVDNLASMIGMLTKLPKTQSPPSLKSSIIEHIREQDNGKGNKD